MELEPRFTASEIAEAVGRVATDMAADYGDKDPLMVGILTVSFVIIADLVIEMGNPVGIDLNSPR
jgi:hypoxanthine-guanine phosphoribosyltransferase